MIGAGGDAPYRVELWNTSRYVSGARGMRSTGYGLFPCYRARYSPSEKQMRYTDLTSEHIEELFNEERSIFNLYGEAFVSAVKPASREFSEASTSTRLESSA